MCKCVLAWVPDPEVTGSHKMRAVSCGDYIAALESLIKGGETAADSDALNVLKAAYGQEVEQPPPTSAGAVSGNDLC